MKEGPKEMASIVQELNSMLESAQQVAWKAQSEKLALEDEVEELRRQLVRLLNEQLNR